MGKTVREAIRRPSVRPGDRLGRRCREAHARGERRLAAGCRGRPARRDPHRPRHRREDGRRPHRSGATRVGEIAISRPRDGRPDENLDEALAHAPGTRCAACRWSRTAASWACSRRRTSRWRRRKMTRARCSRRSRRPRQSGRNAGRRCAARALDRLAFPPARPPPAALWRTRRRRCSARARRARRMMLVGEQPGDQEDLAGRPFVGPAGRAARRSPRRGGDRPRRASTSRTPSSTSSGRRAGSAGSTTSRTRARSPRAGRGSTGSSQRSQPRRARAARRDGRAGAARTAASGSHAAAACRSRTRVRACRARDRAPSSISASATARRGTPRWSSSSPTSAPRRLCSDRSAKVAKLAREPSQTRGRFAGTRRI